jgi:hypothetical protein
MVTPVPIEHRYIATDISIDRSRTHPRDIFWAGDRIQVHGTQTRHHGRVARVNSVGDRRLSVTFEDGLSGKFVEYTDAILIPERNAVAAMPTPARLRMGRPNNVSSRVRTPRPPGHNPLHDSGRREDGHQGGAMRHVDVPPSERRRRHILNRQSVREALDEAWRRPDTSEASVSMGIPGSASIDDDYSILQHDEDTDEEQDQPSTSSVTTHLATDRILDQFSLTAATLIVQCGDENTMDLLLQRFVQQLRLDIDTLASTDE